MDVIGENIKEIDGSGIEKIWTKYYDEGVPTTIDYPVVPSYTIVENAAKKHSNNTSIIFFGSQITYGQINDASDKVAAFLFESGIEKGDRIVVSLPNMPHYGMIGAGISKAGGIIVQCNPIYTEREIRYIVEDSGAKMIFCLDMIYSNVRPILEDGLVEKVILCSLQDYIAGATSPDAPEKKEGLMMWKDVIKYEKTDKRAEINPKEDVAMFQYTGGTTGFPKGVMLT
ncbi:AMP-binding protein, partial [Archaeoglobus sp. JdFR-39]